MAAVTLAAGAATKVVGAVASGGARALARSGLTKHGGKIASLLAKGSLREIFKSSHTKRYSPFGSRMRRF
jgi:hypothetical protein